MDRNNIKSISTITEGLHDEVDKVYEGLMDEDFSEAEQSIDAMIETLKHLKTNFKGNDD